MSDKSVRPESSPISMTPKFIEFILIDTIEDMDDISRRFLGATATRKDFAVQFNILLEDYKGFYGEIGTVDAPVGPLTAKRVGPILGIKMTHGGNYAAHILKVNGLCHHSGKTAWVTIKEWDKVIGDNLQEKLDETIEVKNNSNTPEELEDDAEKK